MTKVPWISQVAGREGAPNFPDARDTGESEDPLGAIVEVDANGLVLARTTRVTEVTQETTDDN